MSGNPESGGGAALRDYSDALPALLVKELRQGLRGRLFVMPFCILHAGLALGSLDRALAGSPLFWLLLWAMLTLLLPARNLSALGEEREANTLDTLMLTGLTPWRIVWGKWAAAAALIGLTALSALPYLVIRWVHGGIPLAEDARMMAAAVVLGLALTAVLTAVSVVRSPLLRNAAAVLCGAFVLKKGYAPGAGGLLPVSLPELFVFAAWAGIFALISAARSLPGPEQGRLLAVRRLAALAAVLLLGLSAESGVGRTVWVVFLTACAAEMTIPEHRRGPEAQRGKLRDLLWSGEWAGGVLFCLVLGALGLLLPASSAQPDAGSLIAIGFLPVSLRLAAPPAWRGGVVVYLMCMVLSWCAANLVRELLPSARGWSAVLFPAPGVRDTVQWAGAALWAGGALVAGLWHLRGRFCPGK